MDSISLLLYATLSLLIHSTVSSPIMALRGTSITDRGTFFEDALLEQDNVDFSALLQDMKTEFLKRLNLSSAPNHESAKVEPPEYMLELYNKFASDRTSMPSANIIRSFKNEDTSSHLNGIDGVRKHALLFNVTVPRQEVITAAELRLYTLMARDRLLYDGVDRKVTIFEVLQSEAGDYHNHAVQLHELASRRIYGTDSGWETFDITEAIKRWHRSRSTTHRLEVHIESVDDEDETGRNVEVDIDVKPENKHEPLLVVFSDDQSREKQESRLNSNDKVDNPQIMDFKNFDPDGFSDSPKEEDLLQLHSNLIYDSTSRIRRNAKSNYCRKTPLKVNFKEIGWDSWVIAPQDYEAFECQGVCSYPLNDHVTPTNHARIKALLHLNKPNKATNACCVPTKLDPIALLYLDDDKVVTYKFKYEGMVVSECGCR
ncbi:bone morphogenetic protein 10 [Protopterus annectens]|uniref:bone morphogenetic protein 10 n=1 Tax=Protopterus annectens TaxID=7888 RepID=UPI001CFB5008|nr:bone morphogenetic protein 10 [Protopterus annectens]